MPYLRKSANVRSKKYVSAERSGMAETIVSAKSLSSGCAKKA